MRHRVHGRKLGRTSAHRKAMFRNQLAALFTHERIITTVAKAKELRPQAERMVTLARTGTLANRRRILQSVPDKEIVGRLFDEIAPRFADRPGGYTRIMRLGRRRGDGAELAIIEFIDYQPKKDDEGGAKGKSSLMDRAKGMFGGGGKADDDVHRGEEAEEAEAPEQAEETEDLVAAAAIAAAAADEAVEESDAEAPESIEEAADEVVAETVEPSEDLVTQAIEVIEEPEAEATADTAEAVEEDVSEPVEEAQIEDVVDDEEPEEKKDD